MLGRYIIVERQDNGVPASPCLFMLHQSNHGTNYYAGKLSISFVCLPNVVA